MNGSWNLDNDTIFGESTHSHSQHENGTAGDEADFFVEVYVGRAPVANSTQAENFVNKTIAYENSTFYNATYLKKALMVGENADDETEGGNSKDLITNIIPQYTTTKLYDRDAGRAGVGANPGASARGRWAAGIYDE